MTKKINVKEHLKKFGIKKLKDKQKTIINNFLKKKDTIGILPTGYGKSICYILPYLMKNKSVIVISPLISLMEDQNNKLKEKNIETVIFNSSHKHIMNTVSGQAKYSNMLKCNEKYILYFSPESFISNKHIVKNLIQYDSLSLIAIDECHCISSWSDFRSDYKELNIIKKWINHFNKKIPILALTATATPIMIDEIINKLTLDNPEIVKENIYRDNLIINISEKHSFDYDVKKIKKYIDNLGDEIKGIIYCKTRADTEKINFKLKLMGIKSEFYHAGLNTIKRKEVQEKFKNGTIKIIIATIAFGMGIDVRDIHLIIHYGISKNIESYYQEIGRGGRNGKFVNCYIFWSVKDFCTNRYFLSKIQDNEFRKKEMKKIIEVEKFINSSGCRMKFICNYFGDKLDRCDKCDNCKKGMSDSSNNKIKKCYDNISNKSVIHRYFVIKTLKNLDYGLGITNFYQILKGSKSKNLKKKMTKINTYGQMKNRKMNEIKKTIRNQLYDGYLIEVKGSNSFGSYYKISKKGNYWFDRNQDKIKKSLNILSKVISKFKKKSKKGNSNKIDKNLYDKLVEWRNSIAKKVNLPNYCILNNKTIEYIIKCMPNNKKKLLDVKGIGKVKMNKYGDDILNIISKNC